MQYTNIIQNRKYNIRREEQVNAYITIRLINKIVHSNVDGFTENYDYCRPTTVYL